MLVDGSVILEPTQAGREIFPAEGPAGQSAHHGEGLG